MLRLALKKLDQVKKFFKTKDIQINDYFCDYWCKVEQNINQNYREIENNA